MNVTLTSLEALILKATHESLPCPDGAALEAFCAIMKDSVEGPMLATQTLAARIHSPNAREAMLALSMLDRCMRRCDAAFHAEVGKFRFLNEMIKLVSPKYFADRTAPEVRTRVLQLLHAWSIEYPKESKFKVAYDMLKNQGVVKETPPPLPPEDSPAPRARTKNAIFEDEEKSKLLQKLLQSKKPEDLQHANRLIKTMVREEERRSEATSRRAQEVGAALDSAELLRDLLARAGEASADETQLIHELHAACARLRPALQRLAAAGTGDTRDIDDILHASDVLDEVFEKYNAFVAEGKKKPKVPAETHAPASLLDFAGSNPGKNEIPKTDQRKNSVIDELGDIFATVPQTSIAEPLKPVNLMGSEDALGEKNTKQEGWSELDSIGERLLKQSLPDNAKRLENFNSKTGKKIPMNELEKNSPKHNDTSGNNGAILDLDFFTTKPEESAKPTPAPRIAGASDDVMVDITTEAKNNNGDADNPLEKFLNLSLEAKPDAESKVDNKEIKKVHIIDIEQLMDINVSLENLRPSHIPPMTIFERKGGVSVVLHFCRDKPLPNVNVIVVCTISKNLSPIADYKFQPLTHQGCNYKVHTLTPSATSLPAFSLFHPPPSITQVMLIARAPSTPTIDFLFVVCVTCKNNTLSEIGEVKLSRLDEIY